MANILESPYTALCIAVVLGALSLSGKLSVTMTQFLLVVTWAVAIVGLRGQPLPVMVGAAAIVAGGLVLLGYWFTPDAIPSNVGVLRAREVSTIFPFKKTTGGQRAMEFGDSGSIIALSPKFPNHAALFNFWDESKLLLEIVDGRLKVSTQIRDPSGELVAELC